VIPITTVTEFAETKNALNVPITWTVTMAASAPRTFALDATRTATAATVKYAVTKTCALIALRTRTAQVATLASEDNANNAKEMQTAKMEDAMTENALNAETTITATTEKNAENKNIAKAMPNSHRNLLVDLKLLESQTLLMFLS